MENGTRKNTGTRGTHTMIGVVDDGLATGVSARAALESAGWRCHPEKLIVAAPICARPLHDCLKGIADEVGCLMTPRNLIAIGGMV